MGQGSDFSVYLLADYYFMSGRRVSHHAPQSMQHDICLFIAACSSVRVCLYVRMLRLCACVLLFQFRFCFHSATATAPFINNSHRFLVSPASDCSFRCSPQQLLFTSVASNKLLLNSVYFCFTSILAIDRELPNGRC